MSSYPPHYAYPSAPPVVRALPKPPRLHWGVLLALQLVTLGLFAMVWYVVQAYWVKRVTGRMRALWWAIAYLVYLPASFLLGMVLAVIAMMQHVSPQEMIAPLQTFIRIIGFILALFAAFTLKSELQLQPVGMSLSGVMTFFFGTIYFQYHLRDWTPEGGDGVPDVTQGWRRWCLTRRLSPGRPRF
jgi:hypothetical protein